MSNKWEDKTAYRRGERGDTDPRTFYLAVPELYDDLVLTRHVLRPGEWLVTLRKGDMERVLPDMPWCEAQQRAEVALVRHLRSKVAAYTAAIKRMGFPV